MNARKKEKLAVSSGRQQRRLVVDQELHDEALKIYNLHGAHENLKYNLLLKLSCKVLRGDIVWAPHLKFVSDSFFGLQSVVLKAKRR